jgi:SAM-dependent methyltransferase
MGAQPQAGFWLRQLFIREKYRIIMNPKGLRNHSILFKIKELLKYPYFIFSFLLFDPLEKVKKFKALPIFVSNLIRYKSLNRNSSFNFRFRDVWYRTFDQFESAGVATGQYFHQDLWAARILFDRNVKKHVDVGSRIDGFISHILPFCEVIYVDIRSFDNGVDGLHFKQGSILSLPFEDDSIPSLSCLHVIEHIGLGRYGDPVNPDGYLQAAKELVRVLQPGGILLLGTPVGRERLCFDAHRIFAPQTVVNAFQPLVLEEMRFIDDYGNMCSPDTTLAEAHEFRYGCGLFLFFKPLK